MAPLIPFITEIDPAPPAATVYVVEDDEAVRTSLELLLRVRGYLSDSFASGEAFLAAGRWRRPACVVVDVRLPGIDGLELARRLRQAQASIPVIVVTAHGDVSTARTALREGAVDFLEKPVDDNELFNAIEQALASDQRRLSLEIERRAHLQRLQKLTAREREVFDRITDGRHNREIAEEFGISPRTVEAHRARIMEKLDAQRVSDLFRMQIALELSDEPIESH
ncbi:MAG: response regulator [Burkholderiaceae bacterium]